MEYNISIEVFEGPLDLLLKLIESNELDIYNIPIHEVTDQFISYIKKMKELDIELASEFIIMASILIEIKSKLLLPAEKIVQDDKEIEVDPRIDLVKKLEEYKIYKDISNKLKQMQEDHLRTFYKIQEDFNIYIEPLEELKDIDLEKLTFAFKKILNRIDNQKSAEESVKLIRYPEIKQEICENNIISALNVKRKVTFNELLQTPTKNYAIAYFLAILELLKLRIIIAYQSDDCEDIIIERVEQIE
ncbi:MAG: segregation/condensation protein A [Tissierellales bacterium]|nr:segregation/condensation protein A [Tissierellales bacterium]